MSSYISLPRALILVTLIHSSQPFARIGSAFFAVEEFIFSHISLPRALTLTALIVNQGCSG